jgi:Holliday junction resolvase RusA-like endonuclease
MIRPPAKVKVSVVWYRERKAGDLDKRIGILLDALQSTAYENDAQVIEIHARREDGDPEHPRIELEVSAL